MSDPWFFERLNLAPSRDVKTIKRAYAVALKLIDQQQEREAFERLRMAYEQALAWAARQTDDEEYEDEDEDTSDPDESHEDEPDEPARIPPPSAPQTDLPPSPPQADQMPPQVPPAPLAPLGDPQPPPPQQPAPPIQPPPRPTAPADAFVTRAESRAAIGAWLARLLAAPPGEHAELLAQAMRDPGMAHLDSQAQLEAQLADALHTQPEGRAPLFQAAAEFFGWTKRHAQAAGSAAGARWIAMVIDQGLQWQEQPNAQLAPQSAALKAARETGAPSRSKAHRLSPTLEAIHAQFPEWLSLQLPPGRLRDWKLAYAALTPGWLRYTRWRKRYAGSVPRILGSLMLLSIILSVGQGLIQAALKKPDAPAAASTPQAPQVVDLEHLPEASDEPGKDPVLAYEFSGAVTADSCEQAHEFVHESNWLELRDTDAKSLLITRALLCQQKKLWPQPSDAMLDCLRQSRIAALSSNKVEDPLVCAKLMSTPKPPPGAHP